MMKMTNEFKTGIVVVAALAVAFGFWMRTANLNKAPYQLKTTFNYAQDIKPDSVVKLSGIDVGRVEKINFIYEPQTKVELVLLVDSRAKVHEDSIAYIATSGLVGDTFIGLTPGSPDKPFAKPGTMLASEDPIEMRKLWKQAEGIAENLDQALIEVKKLAANVNGVVADNRSHIDTIVVNLEATSGNFKEFSEDIKQHPWKLLSKK